MYPVLILAFSNAFRFHKSLPISSITLVQYKLSYFFTGTFKLYEECIWRH